MKIFHHGGRMGDCVYSLYTVRALGGGKMFLSAFHTPGWNTEMANSMLKFLEYQDYIYEAYVFNIPENDLEMWRQTQVPPNCIICGVSYDLHEAELDYNPHEFPEWHGRSWPGNCHIAKRYAVHFRVNWNPESVWLTAPKTKSIDIVFHMPMRRMVRPADEWGKILSDLYADGLNVLILGGMNDIHEWLPFCSHIPSLAPCEFLESADYINSCKVFIGGASSCNTVAEGLKKHRIVELADDCDDTYPYGETGWCANEMSRDEIISLVRRLTR